jgi:hypothetical protein
MFRVNIHSIREHLAAEMIEEERIKKRLMFDDSRVQSPRKRLSKATILSQHRPDVRDVVCLPFSLSMPHSTAILLDRASWKELQIHTAGLAL